MARLRSRAAARTSAPAVCASGERGPACHPCVLPESQDQRGISVCFHGFPTSHLFYVILKTKNAACLQFQTSGVEHEHA